MSLIKVQSGALATAFDLTTLSASEKQLRRTPALGAVRLSADGDRLRVSVAGVAATVSIAVEAAKAEGGEMAVPLQRLADLVTDHSRQAPSSTITADDNSATVSLWRQIRGLSCRSFRFPACRTRYALGKETGHVDARRQDRARPVFAGRVCDLGPR